MVYYQCEKCGYITNHKGKYERHLKRKNHCISQDTVCITKIENPHKPSFFPQKPSFFPHKPSQNPQNGHFENDCMYCGKIFKRRDNLKRHMESYCKILKSQMTLIESEKSTLLDKNIELTTKTIELENKVKSLTYDLINKPTNIITNNVGNTNNIKINNYGCENLDYLTSEKINQLIEAPYTSIPKLIEEVHYHPKHPENHNMKITNKKDPYIKLLDGNTWRLDNRKKVIEGLIEKGKIMLDKYRIEELHSDFKNKCYDQFSDQIEGEDRELIKQMIGDLELLIINKS